MSNTNPLQLLRSSTANKRPLPAGLVDGRPAINTNSASPGLFFKDSAGALVKVGPVHVGATAPNSSPASGGATGNSVGEQWLDTSGGTYVFKVWDGSAWRSESGTFVDVNGDVMTGALGIIAGSAAAPGLYVSGDTNTGLYSPGADQVSLTTGGTERLRIDSTGQIEAVSLGTAAAPVFSFTGDPNTGIYSPGADQVAISTGGSGRLFINSSGQVGVGTSPSYALHVSGTGTVSSRTFATDATGDASFFVQNDGNGICGPLVYGSTKTAYGALASNETALYSNRSTTIMADGESTVIKFATGGNTERLRITSAGLVGIGTSSPATNLEVYGAQGTILEALRLRNQNAGVAGVRQTFWQDYLVAAFTASRNGLDGRLALQTTDTSGNLQDRLFIDGSGRVGIGTSAPGAPLDVSATGTGIKNVIHIRSSLDAIADGGAITFGNTTPATFQLAKIAAVYEGGTYQGSLRFYTNTDTEGANPSEKMRITRTGLVGIGTTSPVAPLHVSGSGVFARLTDTQAYNFGTSGPVLDFTGNDSSGAPILFARLQGSPANGGPDRGFLNIFSRHNGITRSTLQVGTGFDADVLVPNGRLGIGTTSPGDVLDTAAGNYRGITIKCGTTTNRPTLSFVNTADSLAAYIQATGSSLAFGRMGTDYGGHTESARIDSSGRLLVGTSTARANFFNSNVSALFQVEDAGGGASLIRNGNDQYGGALILAKSRGTSNTIVQASDVISIITFQGNDGSEFVEAANISAVVDGTPGANDMPGRLVFSTTADGASSPTERMRIPSSGGLLINATSIINDGLTTIGFQGSIQKGLVLNDTDPANTRQFIGFHISGTTQIGYIANSNNTGVTYSTSSDYRLKENVTPVTDGITRLQQLKPSRFNFIAAPGCTVDGFIAHEVQSVVPEAITGEKDAVDADGKPQYQGIDQSKLVPLLTAALQEAVAKIESLEARLTAAGI